MKIPVSPDTVDEISKIIHQNYEDSPWEVASSGERLWARGTAYAVVEALLRAQDET